MERLFPASMRRGEEPLGLVHWAAVIGSLGVLLWSVPGIIINPDFAVGDDATSEVVLGVDMNGWHALSGFLVGLPGLLMPWARARVAAVFCLAAAGGLLVTALWALASTEVAGGLFYFPHNEADAALHFAVSAIFVVGAAHHFATAEAPHAS